MSLSAGDKVSFLNETGGGEVVKMIDNTTALVLNDDGFEMEYAVSDLVMNTVEGYEYTGPGYESFKEEEQSFGQKKKRILDQWMVKVGKKVVPVVDLHLHELMDDPNQIEHWQKLAFQLSYFDQCLHEAMERKIATLIVVHGIGEGILRDEVVKKLKDRPDIEWYDAPMREFGSGAVQIELKGIFQG